MRSLLAIAVAVVLPSHAWAQSAEDSDLPPLGTAWRSTLSAHRKPRRSGGTSVERQAEDRHCCHGEGRPGNLSGLVPVVSIKLISAAAPSSWLAKRTTRPRQEA